MSHGARLCLRQALWSQTKHRQYVSVYPIFIYLSTISLLTSQPQFTQALDFYLEAENAIHLTELHRLSKLNTPEADNLILHYLMEGIRLNGTFGTYRQYSPPSTSSSSLTIQDFDKQVTINPGDRVFASFVGANRDPGRFPEPEKVKLDRPIESYIHYGIGSHTCLGQGASRIALITMLKTVCKLEGLRRAPGEKGRLKKVPRLGGFHVYMKEDYGSYFPFPLSKCASLDFNFFLGWIRGILELIL